jgi:hypothetical protein
LNSVASFLKNAGIKFHEYLCGGSRTVPCGWMDGETDMTKLGVAFCNFVNMPENLRQSPPCNRILYLKFNDTFENHTFVR